MRGKKNETLRDGLQKLKKPAPVKTAGNVEPKEFVFSIIKADGDGIPIRKTLNIKNVPASVRCKPLLTTLEERKQRFLDKLESLPQKVTAPPKSFFERQLEEIANRLTQTRKAQKQQHSALEKKKRVRPAKKVVLSPEETKALALASCAAERVIKAIENHEIDNDMDVGVAVRREGKTLIVGTQVRTTPLANKTCDIRALELILQPVVLGPHSQDCMAVIRHMRGFKLAPTKGAGLDATLDSFVETVKRETRKLPRLYKDEPYL
ncbi:MAG: hypothetical protein EOM37_02010 [Proteobacteria bacterium]|jgi:hypothetical protein|nr:hypothetical protein [Alphaproteobacteria bacterium]NCC02810.1 hypothetical protein [Pseudomonadota bacterium]